MGAEPVAEVVAAPPAPATSPWIERYVGYRLEGFSPGVHAGVPSHRLTFIVSLGEPVDIAAMPDHRQAPRRAQAFVGGLHTAPAAIAHDGNQSGISVDLTPLGARALFGMPGGELAGHVVDLDELLGPCARSLPDRLMACRSWTGRFAVMDEVLTAALARRDRHRPPPAEVVAAFGLVVGSRGSMAVREVAAAVGWSRRHLADRFREEIGIGPKATARVVRFDHAKRLLAAGAGRRTLADVAADAGYADQAHFTREFRELSGRTPTAWLAEELPSVQDAETLDG